MDVSFACPCSLVASINSARVVEISMWAGLCALSLSLIILAWTRWGNVKTTSKCIWLSVLAHVLLVLYAYETRLFLPGPGTSGGEAIVPITLISESEDSLDAPPESTIDSTPPAPTQLNVNALANLDAPPLLAPDHGNELPEEGEIAVVMPLPMTAPSLLESSENKSAANALGEHEPELSSITEPPPKQDLDSATESVEVAQDESANENSDQVTLGPPQQSDSGLNANAPQSATTELSTTSEQPPSVTEAVAAKSSAAAESLPTSSSDSKSPPAFRASRSVDAQPIAEIYSLRNTAQRRQNAVKRGGTEGTEEAVEKALAWLVEHQQTDGRWNPRLTEAGREFRVLGHDRQGAGSDADTALTGLALLALMGAGHDHLQGKYRDNVRTGLEFILKSQSRSGDLAGDASLFAHMYSHGIATLAVSEAFALTGDLRLKPFVERAVSYSLAAQDPRSGGWRYQPGEEGDMSQFGWQVMALKSAQIGGTTIPTETVQRMKVFLDLCSSGQHMGLAAYRPRQSPSPTMTAEALACRYFLGQSVEDWTADEAAEFIVRQPPGSGEIDYYLWYYATLSLYQRGGPHWEQWNRQLQKQLLGTQMEQGNHAGSWEPNGKWCGYGGRVFSTALATMCLEVYYRYLPMLREQVAWNDETPKR